MKKVHDYIHHTYFTYLWEMLLHDKLISTQQLVYNSQKAIIPTFTNCIYFLPVQEHNFYSIYYKANEKQHEPVCGLVFDDNILAYDFSFNKEMVGTCDRKFNKLENEEYFFMLNNNYDINEQYDESEDADDWYNSPEILLRTNFISLHAYLRKIYIYDIEELSLLNADFFSFLSGKGLEKLVETIENHFNSLTLRDFYGFLRENRLTFSIGTFFKLLKKYDSSPDSANLSTININHHEKEKIRKVWLDKTYSEINFNLYNFLFDLAQEQPKRNTDFMSAVLKEQALIKKKSELEALLTKLNYNVPVEIRYAYTFKQSTEDVFAPQMNFESEKKELKNILPTYYDYDNLIPYGINLFSFS